MPRQEQFAFEPDVAQDNAFYALSDYEKAKRGVLKRCHMWNGDHSGDLEELVTVEEAERAMLEVLADVLEKNRQCSNVLNNREPYDDGEKKDATE